MELKDEFNVKYSCGCVYEIGRNDDNGMWIPSGKGVICEAHAGKPDE